MEQNYKIFIKNVPVILTNRELNKMEADKSSLILQDVDSSKIKDVIEYVEAHTFHSSVILHNEDAKALFRQFRQFFEIVEAAGGLVWSPEQNLLLIYRHDKWDLPKGKIEPDEEADDAALREIQEECGIAELTLNDFFSTSYHTYWQKDQRVLKVTYWFDIQCTDPQNINPQTEEGIETIRWMEASGLRKAMDNTFPNLQALFEQALQRIT